MCDQPDYHHTIRRKARREHRCVECGGIIPSGQEYDYTTQLFEGSWANWKTCLPCVAAIDDWCKEYECYLVGDLIGEITGNINPPHRTPAMADFVARWEANRERRHAA